MAKQDVTVELFYSSQWNDHTSDVLTRDEISITRGRQDESSQPAPTTCELTFHGWNFNPANPSSPLSGLIGRNTPLRVLYRKVTEGFEDATLDITTTDGPGTPDWARTQTEAHSGTWSFGAENVNDSESAVDITIPSGVDSVSFWWRRDSGIGRLETELDGVPIDFLTGTAGVWRHYTLNVAGASTLTLIQFSGVANIASAFIDDLTFDHVRFAGEVSSWTPRQSLGGGNAIPDRWVEVEAAGATRRLGQGQDPLDDAVRRYMTVGDGATSLVGYWPLTDGADSRQGGAIVGGPMIPPMRVIDTPPQWSRGTLAPHLPPVVRCVRQSGLFGSAVRGRVSMSGFAWVLDFAYHNEGGSFDQASVDGQDASEQHITAEVNLANPPRSGQPEEIQVKWVNIDDFGVPVESFDFSTVIPFDEQMHHFRLVVTPSGASSSDFELFLDGVSILADTASMRVTPSSVQVTGGIHLDPSGVADFGHVALWEGSAPLLDNTIRAYEGFAGEHAGDRFIRLTSEENITSAILAGTDEDTVPLGPQYPDGFLDILREAAGVDAGTLLDQRAGFGALHYRTGRSHYNQAAALELDYDQAHVAPPLEPVLDDQGTRNDVTAKRRDGGEARKVDQDSVDAIGRYDTSVTVNVMGDGMLGDQAGWRLHLGSGDGTRFPQITVDLDAVPALVASVDPVDVGDLVTVDNLPPELTPDLASLLVLGYTERIGSHRRRITFNLTPEEPYHISELEHADYGIIGSGGSTVATQDYESGTHTSIGVAIATGHPDWVYEGDFDILLGGVRVTVTGVTGSGGSQIFNVSQTPVNGVIKTVPIGTPIDVFHKSYIGL